MLGINRSSNMAPALALYVNVFFIPSSLEIQHFGNKPMISGLYILNGFPTQSKKVRLSRSAAILLLVGPV